MNPDSSFEPGLASAKLSYFPARELAITALYLLLASAWVVASDRWLERWRPPSDQATLQTVKGLNFVLVTSSLIYVVLRRAHSRRRRAEFSLRELSERFELVARASNDAIFDWNLVTNTLWRSYGYTRLFGWQEEECGATIDTWVANLHPEERERIEKSIHSAIESGTNDWSAEYRYRRKRGTYAFVHDRGFIVHDGHGKPVRMVGGITDISEQKQATDQLRETQAQLRALTSRLESLRENERFRISREIHDQLGQVLTGVKMSLASIENRIAKLDNPRAFNPILERVVEANELVEESIKTVQRIASDLRPAVLDSLGLVSALRYEAARFSQRTGIAFSLNVGRDASEVPTDVSVAAFRIFQEALTNIARHAYASRIEIDVDITREHVELEICDNGRGIDARILRDPHSIGLLGMKERALAHGGSVVVEPRVQGGTRVIVHIPFAADLLEATSQCAYLS